MLVVLISWVYISAVCLLTGMLVREICQRILHLSYLPTVMEVLMTGIVALTVYAQYFSIVHKIGILAHLIMLLACATSVLLYKEQLRSLLQSVRQGLRIQGDASYRWNEIAVYLFVLLVAAFFVSRGDFHADTKLYHAQAIRQLEEYGMIRGQANLQMQFGYNSAYFLFAALFTMSPFMSPAHALHTTTGFLFAIMTLYSIYGLLQHRQNKSRKADMVRVAVLIYTLTNLYYANSPASDYAAMLMTLYVLLAWLEASSDDAPVGRYGMLSVFVMCVISIKLSGAALILFALYPAFLLLREKRIKQVGLFLLAGFLVFLPFLVRNVFVSGYLFYPQMSVDLFNVPWKVPAENVRVDLGFMLAYARGLVQMNGAYTPELDAWPVTKWLPVWWRHQEYYEQRLIYALAVGTLLAAMTFLRKRVRKIKPEMPLLIWYMTCYSSITLWFLSAPFIRYGLAFLLAVPLVAVGDVMDLACAKPPRARVSYLGGGYGNSYRSLLCSVGGSLHDG